MKTPKQTYVLVYHYIASTLKFYLAAWNLYKISRIHFAAFGVDALGQRVIVVLVFVGRWVESMFCLESGGFEMLYFFIVHKSGSCVFFRLLVDLRREVDAVRGGDCVRVAVTFGGGAVSRLCVLERAEGAEEGLVGGGCRVEGGGRVPVVFVKMGHLGQRSPSSRLFYIWGDVC